MQLITVKKWKDKQCSHHWARQRITHAWLYLEETFVPLLNFIVVELRVGSQVLKLLRLQFAVLFSHQNHWRSLYSKTAAEKLLLLLMTMMMMMSTVHCTHNNTSHYTTGYWQFHYTPFSRHTFDKSISPYLCSVTMFKLSTYLSTSDHVPCLNIYQYCFCGQNTVTVCKKIALYTITECI